MYGRDLDSQTGVKILYTLPSTGDRQVIYSVKSEVDFRMDNFTVILTGKAKL